MMLSPLPFRPRDTVATLAPSAWAITAHMTSLMDARGHALIPRRLRSVSGTGEAYETTRAIDPVVVHVDVNIGGTAVIQPAGR